LKIFSNIDIVFHHGKELTLKCAQTGEKNIFFKSVGSQQNREKI